MCNQSEKALISTKRPCKQQGVSNKYPVDGCQQKWQSAQFVCAFVSRIHTILQLYNYTIALQLFATLPYTSFGKGATSFRNQGTVSVGACLAFARVQHPIQPERASRLVVISKIPFSRRWRVHLSVQEQKQNAASDFHIYLNWRLSLQMSAHVDLVCPWAELFWKMRVFLS